MPKKPNPPSKEPNDDEPKSKKSPDKKKKQNKKEDADTKRDRPQRQHYNNFVSNLSEESQDRQMWGIFSWIKRVRQSGRGE